MQRQKSILSLWQKPSPASQNGAVGEVKGQGASLFPSKQNLNGDVCGSSLEVTGTDTPPEKVPRKVLPVNFASNAEARGSSSLFSSIMHKFVKADDRENGSQRNQAADKSYDVEELPRVELIAKPSEKTNVLNVENDDDLRPETPATRPGVSRFKRIQDYFPTFGDKDNSLLDSSKRIKLLQESIVGNNNHKNDSDVASKFEWLDPSRIRDANGRRPSDPLYDKKTLFIPPDVLKNMSASQKQYWGVKCQYMDIVLFFKVGKFYELYEIDAEIGHKELDWKMTVSGVGKCRQWWCRCSTHGIFLYVQGNYGVENGSTTYGFAFVDCAALKFWVGSISDDATCSALGALLMQVSPKEVIYEHRGTTAVQLSPGFSTDFLDASEVRNMIQSKGYFKGSPNSYFNAFDGVVHHDVAVCALGGLVSHMSRLMLKDILQSGDVLPYHVYQGCLRIDGQTIVNLEIFSNSADGGSSGKWFHVKAFGTLVKGLWSGMDLLRLLQKDADMVSLLSKVFKFPILSGANGLDEFLTQFEAAIESDFPNYQNHDLTDSDAETLSILIELFIEKASQWSQVIHALNCIDVLRSFAVTASFSSGTMARPVVLPQSKTMTSNQGGPILKITGLWHPFALGENGVLPVPNDIFLGEGVNDYTPRALLLTGPNMGGKSTLLRATCLAVMLAQLGSFVPCETCIISLVDTIFTRLGATDRIMTGESTFLVECTETASVLQNATQDSLVLLDELGRGTSTFDGYAIAYAVFRHLVEKVHCRLLFATHYHPLTKEFASHPHVILQHMACSFKVKSEGCSKGEQEPSFLYRLTNGACPESYGLQVAIMAGIPEKVVEAASKAGQVMKISVGESFKSSEQRSEFSTLHEEWLRSLNVRLEGLQLLPVGGFLWSHEPSIEANPHITSSPSLLLVQVKKLPLVQALF
ncbi:hypothetical protein GOBAR_DD30144 [Gossypium barbadense]|nr:hypothetical protein GOBAR_DD30144 [Gossypium barbadense]